MILRSRERVGRFPHPGGKLLTGGGVRFAPLDGSREFVLQLQKGDDHFDVLPRHPSHRHFVPRLLDCRLCWWYACAGDADQKGNVLRPDGRERHDPSGLANAQQSNLSTINIAACLQVLDGGHDVAGQIVERSRVPVSRRSTYTPFVIPEHHHAAAYQEPRPRKHIFPILGAGAVHEDNCGMCSSPMRPHNHSRELNVATREANVFTYFDLAPPPTTPRPTLRPPRQ